ncbi:hypothetical protein [Fructobacillus cardui]|uniref:hypothetical protein n=1 Tax=Fructobacillus cardui TaxID=2893170 RepID=UPI0030C82350
MSENKPTATAIAIAMQKTAQSMLTLIQGGGFSLNNQIGFGLTSTLVATLSNLHELPEEMTKAIGITGIVAIVLGIMLNTFYFV